MYFNNTNVWVSNHCANTCTQTKMSKSKLFEFCKICNRLVWVLFQTSSVCRPTFTTLFDQQVYYLFFTKIRSKRKKVNVINVCQSLVRYMGIVLIFLRHLCTFETFPLHLDLKQKIRNIFIYIIMNTSSKYQVTVIGIEELT